MVTVKVPATSANIGSGFDSIGIALSLYNTISARETDAGALIIEVLDETAAFLPLDGRNLVYRSMQTVFREAGYKPRGLHITLKNDIPVTRGLGSSSASIVGGMLAANELCGAGMSREDFISAAAAIEGHPDNTTPAITGGMAFAVIDGDKTWFHKADIPAGALCFAALIPDFILRTKKARSVLPPIVSHADAVYNVGRAALLSASVLSGDYQNLQVALDDRLHQPYRKRFIRGFDALVHHARACGALGSYLSGAGPTVISILEKKEQDAFSEKMSAFLAQQTGKWNLMILQPDNDGARII